MVLVVSPELDQIGLVAYRVVVISRSEISIEPLKTKNRKRWTQRSKVLLRFELECSYRGGNTRSHSEYGS